MEFNKRTGYVFIRTQPGHTKRVFDNFRNHDWVIGAWTVTGDYDIIAFVNATSYDDLYTWTNTIRKWEGVDNTNTHYTYNGFVSNPTTFSDKNGVWVHARTDRIDTAMTTLKDYPAVTAWANTPGDYDLLLWVNGPTLRDTLENVLRMTEGTHWGTRTYVPVYNYFNPKYTNKI